MISVVYLFTGKTNEDEEVLIAAGGFDGANILTSVEVFSPENNCNGYLPSLPFPIYGHGLFFMNNTLLACGGDWNHCFELKSHSKKWKIADKFTMHNPRLMGAYTISSRGIIYFSGGYPFKDTLEYMDQFKDNWNLLQQNISRVRHCMVTLDNGNVVLIGGRGNGHSVKMFDVDQEKFVQLTDITFYLDR